MVKSKQAALPNEPRAVLEGSPSCSVGGYDTNNPDRIKRHLVLIADDAEDSRTLFAMMLKPRYDTRLASSGMAALHASVQEPQPELILLDVVMPDLDGYEVLKRLKENPATADIPVILVTARTGPKKETQEIGRAHV